MANADDTHVHELTKSLAEEWAGVQDLLTTLDEGVRRLIGLCQISAGGRDL